MTKPNQNLRRLTVFRWRLFSDAEVIELWEAAGESQPYNADVGYPLYDELTAELERRDIHHERRLVVRGKST